MNEQGGIARSSPQERETHARRSNTTACGLNVERIWECGGLKFLVCDGVLIRRNAFHHIRNACGLWLDVSNRNCRITGNVFADIETLQGGVFMECSHDLNPVDGNVFWDIRTLPAPWGKEGERTGGHGVTAGSTDKIVIALDYCRDKARPFQCDFINVQVMRGAAASLR